MSNGIGKNPLNDISKVYLTQVAEKKDDSYLEPDMKKRQKNNEKARKELAKGPQMKNPHFEEKQQGWDSVNSLTDAFKGMQEVEHVDEMIDPKGAARMDAAKGKKKETQDEIDKRLMLGKYSPAVRYGKTQKEGLDPVGKEDGDVNNDGKKNKTDKYLMNRRKAIGSAIKNKMSSMKKEETEVAEYIETVAKVKEAERQNDIKRWVQKESRSSNWRNDLSEVMTDDIDSTPIKEKNVKNKIKINPKLGEAIEEIGGTIVEMVEVGEAVYGGTPEKKKDDRMTVTNADKKANTPAYRAYKAGNKKYKSADHMNEGDGDPCWDSHKQVGMKKKGGKMVPNCVPKNEEVEVEGYVPMDSAKKAKMDRQSNKAYAKEVVAAHHGKSKEANKQMQRRIAMQDPQGRKTVLSKKNEEVSIEEDAAMSPQEIALQKKKAMLDRMIAQRRQQGLNKVKKSEAPAKAMGEGMECDHSIKGKECPVHGKKDCSSMKEATEDSLRDRRMERGGVDGNNRYNKPVSNTPNTFGKKKPVVGGPSALEKVKASIRAKHGQGAIKEDAKMAKQSDEKLAALHKQVSSSDQSLPSNQFMMKRVSKEMNRRKKAT